MATEKQLRTGAWYGDSPLLLHFPPEWDVAFHWPRTPPPLTDAQIHESLERPVGQPPLREFCRGKSRPLIIVDDLNRPTPAARVMPFLLLQLRDAGIPARNVTVLMARGSHGAPRREAMQQKIGAEAASSCRFLLHDPTRKLVKIGKTSFGTPVVVNREVLAADFVVGIGGVYPNRSAGFGGGSKLALGVLDLRVISYLHHQYRGSGWGTEALQSDFRKDLDEIAQMIRLQSLISLHVDAHREPVRMTSGDYRLFYPDEVAFARQVYAAPSAHGADVVIANAYPNDLSLTFVHMKGIVPLEQSPPAASRIVLAACSEGEGFHRVYPMVRVPLLHEARVRLGRISLMDPLEIAGKLSGKILRKLGVKAVQKPVPPRAAAEVSPQHKYPIWLYRTGNHSGDLPPSTRGVGVVSAWSEILEIVRREQGTRCPLRVFVYPCAPLQILDAPGEASADRAEVA